MSHMDLRINPNTPHMCVRIKFYTYDDSVYSSQCHKLYYITKMSYKITRIKINWTKITISIATVD
jgi:hypothetical protein